MTRGIITHIQRFSVHDGPGIRTTVFLKGCQMGCPWCHNPESRNPHPEIQAFADRCIGCRYCVGQCEQGGHEFVGQQHVFHRERCIACGRCAQSCYARAMVLVGQTRTAQEVVDEVLADREFYESSGGGVTISGGEPLAQSRFTYAILKLCKQAGIRTAIETNLAWPWSIVESLADVTDLFMVDIKVMDDGQHRELTGVSNRPILENLRRLDRQGKPSIVRTPLIAGLNDGPEQIESIADWLAELSAVRQYELLPYHPLGTGKYEALGLAGPPEDYCSPSHEHLRDLVARASRPNLVVKAAGVPAVSANHDEGRPRNPASSRQRFHDPFIQNADSHDG